MTTPIGPLSGPVFPQQAVTPPNANDTADAGFGKLLQDALQSTSGLQNHAEQSIQTHLAGGDITNVEVMTDLRKADLAMKLMLQIRNKLLEGFNEIKQMQF